MAKRKNNSNNRQAEGQKCKSLWRGFSLEKSFLVSMFVCALLSILMIENYYRISQTSYEQLWKTSFSLLNRGSTVVPTASNLPTSISGHSQLDNRRSEAIARHKPLSPCDNPAAPRPWSNNTDLPDYIKEYFDWHVETTCKATAHSHTDVKYLIVQCLKEFGSCGGLSDRLRQLPAYIIAAYKMKRVLLFQWTKPCPIEEFFISPPYGINWTVPEWLPVPTRSYAQIQTFKGLSKYIANNQVTNQVLTIKIQYPSIGFYNEHIGSLGDRTNTYTRVYRSLFYCMFALVPQIQSMVNERMEHLTLIPGTYVSVHVRARHPDSGHYNVTKRKDNNIDKYGGLQFEGQTRELIISTVEKALNCASLLRNSSATSTNKIYFASDSHHVNQYVLLQNNRSSSSLQITGILHRKEPLHFDKPMDENEKPCDFYDSFVDIWLLSNAKCTVSGVGGYGLLASYLSKDPSCHINYLYKRQQDCSREN